MLNRRSASWVGCVQKNPCLHLAAGKIWDILPACLHLNFMSKLNYLHSFQLVRNFGVTYKIIAFSVPHCDEFWE